MKNLTDFEIIESIKRGNHSDFSILVDRYKNKAFSLLKRMLKNDMEAEEMIWKPRKYYRMLLLKLLTV